MSASPTNNGQHWPRGGQLSQNTRIECDAINDIASEIESQPQPQRECKVTCAFATVTAIAHSHTPHTTRCGGKKTAAAVAAGQPRLHMKTPDLGLQKARGRAAGLLGAGPMAVMRADDEEQLDLVKLELFRFDQLAISATRPMGRSDAGQTGPVGSSCGIPVARLLQ